MTWTTEDGTEPYRTMYGAGYDEHCSDGNPPMIIPTTDTRIEEQVLMLQVEMQKHKKEIESLQTEHKIFQEAHLQTKLELEETSERLRKTELAVADMQKHTVPEMPQGPSEVMRSLDFGTAPAKGSSPFFVMGLSMQPEMWRTPPPAPKKMKTCGQ